MTVQPIDPDITPGDATAAFNRAVGNANWRQVREYARTGKVDADSLSGALQKAARARKSGTITTLVEAGANIEQAPDDLVLQALGFNDHSAVITLLEYGADLHANDDELFVRALGYRGKKLTQKLLERGANVNAQGGKPLVITIKNDMTDEFDRFLEIGADPGLSGGSALVAAIQSKRPHYYKTLMKRDDIDVTAGDNAALKAATATRQIKYMSELIDRGADPAARRGEIFLQAAKSGFVGGVKLLLERAPENARHAHRASVAAIHQKSKMPNQKTPHLDAVIEYLSPYTLRHMLAMKKISGRKRRTAP